MRYEEMVRRYCGENWKTINENEREGGMGVACVLGYIRGNVKPSIPDLAAHLGVPPDDIVSAYARLQRNGIFSPRFNARKDEELTGHPSDTNTQRAWAHIAAISGGFLGV